VLFLIEPLTGCLSACLDEASALLGMPVTNLGEMRTAAHRLHEIGAENIVITGGDFQEGSDKGKLDRATDLLSFLSPQGKFEQQVFKAERQRSRSTHGTGCAYAFPLTFCGSRRDVTVGTNWGPHVVRDAERHARP